MSKAIENGKITQYIDYARHRCPFCEARTVRVCLSSPQDTVRGTLHIVAQTANPDDTVKLYIDSTLVADRNVRALFLSRRHGEAGRRDAPAHCLRVRQIESERSGPDADPRAECSNSQVVALGNKS